MTDPLTPPTPRPTSFFGKHRDLVGAVVSGFVGALALATSTYNVYLQRQQVRAQVWPCVVMGTDFSNDGFSLGFDNRGVGPAAIKRERVLVDGKPAEDWFNAVTLLLRKESLRYVPEISATENVVMSPGMEITALKIPDFDDAREIMSQMDRLTIEVCYCSTLDDCWVFRRDATKEETLPVSSCTPDPEPFHSVGAKTMASILAKVKKGKSAKDGGDGGRE